MRRECYWMISKYVKEQKRYTQDELRKIFECTADETVQIIRKLKEYGIVKNVKKSDRQSMLSDLVEEDIRVTDIESGERELYYVFSFVGVIVVYGRVLKCYPKYINSCGSPVAQMKQIMRVLEKYNSKEQVIKLYNESDDGGSFNLLAVMLYLLQDYYDNGIYANDVDIVETNGTGEILWDRTINETFSYISNNRPYYTELQTKKRTSDEYDFIRRFASEGKGNTEWKQWAEAEKDDIALIMRRYGIDWKKKNMHNPHLSVLDYKKQERVKEVAALEEKLEGAQVVLELKEERIESLEKEIEDKHVSIRKEQSEAQKMLDDTKAETRKLQFEGTDLRLKNSELRLEYSENVDKLTDIRKEIEEDQKEADKWMMISDTAKWQT